MTEIKRPFVYDFTPTSFSKRIDSSSELPSKLARRSWLVRDDCGKKFSDFEEAKILFDEMRERYDIKVVGMDFVVGKDNNNSSVIYTVVDNIIGPNLREINEFPAELQSEAENFIYALAKYYSDKFDSKEKYWNDIKLEQFVYGHKFNQKDKHFYLVDVDPFFNNKFPSDKSNLRWFGHTVAKLYTLLVQIENRFEPPVKFSRARQIIAEINEKISAQPKQG